MGEVWRAEDLVLGATVALKLVYSTSRDARERLLREVRLARQITHPAVCRVFDVGEADGQVFYSMEYVEGEDLATLLRRAGRLPQERVLEIGRQLAEGMSAAHAQGVLHRDLKPANVLIDENGSVRITDFGIAIARSDGTGATIVGTPGYMAPEQLVQGASLTERTDVYAIGLILYELLVGERPFREPGVQARPPRPANLVPEVDPRLERAILKALASTPAARPESAAALANALPEGIGLEARRRTPWLAGAGLAAVVALVAVAASLVWSRGGTVLSDQDTIVLADFANTTGEVVFDGTLKVALAVALEQSPFLKVYPDDGVRETLRLMQRPADERVTRDLAREIARRERLKALVSGSIGSLGSHYVIAIEAINAESGDVMAREQVEAASREEVLSRLGEATSRLRAKLGESLPSIARFDVPLARATTSSLEALHAYSLALLDGRIFPRVEAIPHLRRAIELDPDFALAEAQLSGMYANTGQASEAPPHARRAYELRDRVSERERYFISWRYYVDALQAWDRALELAQSWTTAYPREAFAFNSLGLAAVAFGDYERAAQAFEQAIRLDPRFIPPHRNLAATLIARNRYEEARAAIDRWAGEGISTTGLRQLHYVLAVINGDPASLSAAVDAVRAADGPAWSSNVEARTAVFEGRVGAAHARFQEATQLALKEGLPGLATGWMLEEAEMHALADQCPAAVREVDQALVLAPDAFALQRAARTMVLCGEDVAADRLVARLKTSAPEATLVARLHVPVIAATLALERGNPSGVLDVLKPVQPYETAPSAEFWPTYLRGQAHLALGDAESARAAFEAILSRRGQTPTSPLYPLARLGLARALRLGQDLPAARSNFELATAFWNRADPDFPPAKEARDEVARLR